ncbi:hypothetical protein G9A89_004926 [Geosiphon pyriformis]|nr:hypothetical protein G9A89_004926 [Geosiphon pyriformis]
MVVKKIRKVSGNDCRTLNKISEILQHSITLLLYKLPLSSEDNNRTIISGFTAALGALETGGASEAGNALETVAVGINKVTLIKLWLTRLLFLHIGKKN